LTSPLRLQSFRDPRDLHSFPTRRSSDLIGFVLGTDYAVNKAVLIEFLPRHVRDRILGSLAIFWAGGYACAYFAAFALDAVSEQSWRWMLLSSAVPCLAVLPFRLSIPESPLWLTNHGYGEAAARI